MFRILTFTAVLVAHLPPKEMITRKVNNNKIVAVQLNYKLLLINIPDDNRIDKEKLYNIVYSLKFK